MPIDAVSGESTPVDAARHPNIPQVQQARHTIAAKILPNRFRNPRRLLRAPRFGLETYNTDWHNTTAGTEEPRLTPAQRFLGLRIGVSHPAMSAGLASVMDGLKLNVDGL